jgi:hypothetical protein
MGTQFSKTWRTGNTDLCPLLDLSQPLILLGDQGSSARGSFERSLPEQDHGTINRGINTSEKNGSTLLSLVGQLLLATARGPFAAELLQHTFVKNS